MEGASSLPFWEDPVQLAALYRNVCMIIAFFGAVRITWLGLRRYKAEPAWQVPVVGGMLLAGAYMAIIAVGGGPLGDSFFNITHAGKAGTQDFVFLLKSGVLIAIIGAFSVAKRATS